MSIASLACGGNNAAPSNSRAGAFSSDNQPTHVRISGFGATPAGDIGSA
jgi:hypothetical protein